MQSKDHEVADIGFKLHRKVILIHQSTNIASKTVCVRAVNCSVNYEARTCFQLSYLLADLSAVRETERIYLPSQTMRQ